MWIENIFFDNSAFRNLVWKYFKMYLQYFEEKIYFYQNVLLYFYINIVCKNILYDVALTLPRYFYIWFFDKSILKYLCYSRICYSRFLCLLCVSKYLLSAEFPLIIWQFSYILPQKTKLIGENSVPSLSAVLVFAGLNKNITPANNEGRL